MDLVLKEIVSSPYKFHRIVRNMGNEQTMLPKRRIVPRVFNEVFVSVELVNIIPATNASIAVTTNIFIGLPG